LKPTVCMKVSTTNLKEEGLVTYKDFIFQHLHQVNKLIVDIYLNIMLTR